MSHLIDFSPVPPYTGDGLCEEVRVDVSIQTARLVLRTVTREDVDAVALSWRPDGRPLAREEAEAQVSRMLENHRHNAPGSVRHLCLAMVHQRDQRFIGWCGLDHGGRSTSDWDPARAHPVLFYLLHPDYRGQGLATEAAAALLGYAFGELGLAQVDGGAAFENSASRRVMEKIGMRYLGLNEEGGHAFTLKREEYCQSNE
jgi:RimJ/RimL family protein N-acetyltransferase